MTAGTMQGAAQEGLSILAVARERHGIAAPGLPAGAQVVPFAAQTRISGLDLPYGAYRKGAVDSLARFVGAEPPPALR